MRLGQMHEMAISEGIVRIVESQLENVYGDVSVERINLRVGKLSGVVVETLRFCFEIVARDTRLRGASLGRVFGKLNFLFNRRERREDAEFAEFFLCVLCASSANSAVIFGGEAPKRVC